MKHVAPRRLRLAHLYPNVLNLYGDRGNIYTLQQRCRARGIELEVHDLPLGELLDPRQYDLYFLGGGQDREQWRIAEDLLTAKGPGLREAIDAGAPALTVCGGYQLLGHYYQTAGETKLPGLGLYDLITIHPGESASRCIGNLLIACDVDGAAIELAGFENHGGRTRLGPGATPLGRVVAGHGNNGEDRTEGCRYRNAFGTYLHGPLLPKNPRFADYLLHLALERKYGEADLAPLDDGLAQRAHAVARARALTDARRTGWSGVAQKTRQRLRNAGRRLT